MSKKKSKKKKFGKYYYQGNPDPEIMEMICEMLHRGITVYHQFGVPPNPPKDPPH